MLRSATTQPSATGTTMKESSAVISTRDGATHEHAPVGERRHPVLLEEDLERVGQHLQQAGRADAVGAVAVLHEAEQPALVPDQAGGDGERDDQHHQDRQQRPVPGGALAGDRAGRGRCDDGAHDGASTRARRTRAGSEM